MALETELFSMGTFSSRNDLYQRMIEEIQDYAIILLDINGIICNWNKGAQKIKLYTEKEIVGRHFKFFIYRMTLITDCPKN